MRNKKHVFRVFTLDGYEKEAAFLEKMQLQGWQLSGVTPPGIYHFERSEEKTMHYRLDLDPAGREGMEAYRKMFSDYGWEYVLFFRGYCYFRKHSAVGQQDRRVFCTEQDRMELLKSIMLSRILPLILFFAVLVVPQLLFSAMQVPGGDAFSGVMTVLYLLLAVLFVPVCAYYLLSFLKMKGKLKKEASLKEK